MTGSPFTTTSGGGTPTGSGVRGRSARRTRASAGSGRGVTGAAASTGSCIGYDRRFNIADRIEKRNGRPPRERVVQDVELPIERTVEFVDWFLSNVPIEPLWLCPLRLRDDGDWPLYPLAPAPHLRQRRLLVVGAGRSRLAIRGRSHQQADRARRSRELDGHKSLYSDAFYSRDEFDELYGGEDIQDGEEDLRSRLTSA